MTSSARRRWLYALVTLLALLLLVRALEVRLPEMTRPFWEDEIHHNEPIVATHSIAELNRHPLFIWEFQPVFDYAVRQVFWFKLFGAQELGIRIPSLIFGVLMVEVLFALSLWLFRARGIDPFLAAFLAFLVALWLVNNPTEIHDAAEARHYSFISLASTLFCVLFFVNDGTPAPAFAAVSLLFGNLHFFSLPMIALAYGALSVQGLAQRPRRWAPLAWAVGVAVALALCTRFINYTPFQMLLKGPPAEVNQAKPHLAQAFREGLGIWVEFQRYLALPLPAWILWLLIGLTTWLKLRWRKILFVAAVFVALPAFFVYCRYRSSYTFYPRYFAPFCGIGAATLLLFAEAVIDGWQRFGARLRQPNRVAIVLVAVAALLFGVPSALKNAFAEAGSFRRLPQNFSPYFRAYEEIKRSGKPVFVLHSHCFTNDIPIMYLQFIGDPIKARHHVADSKGCESSVSFVKGALDDFLRTAHGMVVLDQKEDDCSARSTAPAESLPPGVQVRKVQSVSNCIWEVEGAQSRSELGAVAKAVKFDGLAEIYR
jgi:hypothetical protein